MNTSKRVTKTAGVGDAAVEGLMYGILAGVIMAVFLIVVEFAAGNSPLTLLGYFDASSSGSPFVGLFTHIAVSGIYGVVFGILALILVRLTGARITLPFWMVLGLVYGLIIFGIGEAVLLPRTHSALREISVGAFAASHLVYGVALAWLMGRRA